MDFSILKNPKCFYKEILDYIYANEDALAFMKNNLLYAQIGIEPDDDEILPEGLPAPSDIVEGYDD